MISRNCWWLNHFLLVKCFSKTFLGSFCLLLLYVYDKSTCYLLFIESQCGNTLVVLNQFDLALNVLNVTQKKLKAISDKIHASKLNICIYYCVYIMQSKCCHFWGMLIVNSSQRRGPRAACATVRQGKADLTRDGRKSQPSPGNRELATTALPPVEELGGKHLFKAVMNMLF